MARQIEEDIIAKKYALAFLNVYGDEYTKESLEKFAGLEEFIQENQHLYVSLRIPNIPLSTKKMVLDKLAESYSLGESMKTLMHRLLDDGRIEILDKILRHIGWVYKRKYNIERFDVATSHTITKAQKEKIIAFIKSRSDAQLLTRFVVDPSLIVGVRIESNTFLWERSVKYRLRSVGDELLRDREL